MEMLLYMQHIKESGAASADCCPVHAGQAVDQAWGKGDTEWAAVQSDQKRRQHVVAREQRSAPYHA